MLNSIGKMVKVSVIIPLYLAEKNIEKCINSCLQQTEQDIEVIVINNDATNSSAQIVYEYSQKSNCVYSVTTEHHGLNETKNMDLRIAKGKFIYFLNPDCWIDSKCFETCIYYAENNDLDMVQFDAYDELKQSVECSSHVCDKKIGYEIKSGYEYVRDYLKECSEVNLCNVLIRKSFLEENDILLNQIYYADLKFYFDCMIKAKRVMYVPFQFCHEDCCTKGDNIIEKDIGNIESAFFVSMKILDEIRNYKGLGKEIWFKYGQILIHNILELSFGQVNCRNIHYFQGQSDKILKCLVSLIREYLFLAKTVDFSLHIYDSALEFVHVVLFKIGYCPKGGDVLLSEIEKYRREVIIEKVRKLPLSDVTKRVGVYGAGKHADFILNFYREYIGDITGKLVYLDSNQESYVVQKDGLDIVNIKDINSLNLDFIIVLSYIYEKEMVLSAKAALKEDIPIYTLYDGDSYPLDIRRRKARILEKELKELPNEPDKNKRIVLLNLPNHANVGDYMITLTEEKFINKHFPQWEVLEFSEVEYEYHREEVGYQVRITDVVCITGGGFLGNLWFAGGNVNKILEDFKANKIIIFPQSLYFKKGSEDEIEELCKKLLECVDVTVCFREEISYHRAEDIIKGRVKLCLLPDFVLGLDIELEEQKREGILLCLRNDIESLLVEVEKYEIWNKVKDVSDHIFLTSMHWKEDISNEDKDSVILQKLETFKESKLVITDTLHCMISCAITGTPCIAINNLTDKIKGVYNWIKNLPYIEYFDTVDEFINFDLANWSGLKHNWKYQSVFAEYEHDFRELISSN